jgi:hypothetical protein
MICLDQFDQSMSSHRKIANLESAIHLIRGHRVMLDSDLAAIYGVTAKKLQELERRLDSHDEGIANLFAALKQLLEPSEPTKRREIGFHVREKAARYRVRRRSKINDRISRIS